MIRRPDRIPAIGIGAGSLFRAGIGVRLVAAAGLSALLWTVILWAGA